MNISMADETRNESALVLGNGPSAKLIDFELLKRCGLTTVGMNAAYRYWRRVGFRPTHYICMDTVVLKSHRHEIVDLIKEGEITAFFLRDEIKEHYPELASDQRILWYSDARNTHSIFQTNFVTTGSWAIRWMINLKKELVATIGIDSNYVELIAEAQKISGDAGDLRLKLTKTPDRNPNYFFEGYQKEGDSYNIPNDPDYLAKNGSLVHIDALKAVNHYLKEYNSTARIVDLSPLSKHGAFPKQSASRFFRERLVTVVTSFYLKSLPETLINNIKIALMNAAVSSISAVHILFEGKKDDLLTAIGPVLAERVQEYERIGSLKIHPINERPNYSKIFKFCNNLNIMNIAVANSDIIFTEDMLKDILWCEIDASSGCIALTRWNATKNGLFIQDLSSNPPWTELDHQNFHKTEQNPFSFDVYFFKGLISIPDEVEAILLGTLGCDTALVAVLKLHGYIVVNPCLSIRTIHFDTKPRTYTSPASVSDLINNVESVWRALQRRFSGTLSDQIIRFASASQRGRLWVGHPQTMNLQHAFHRAVGATPWAQQCQSVGVDFIVVELDISEVDSHDFDLSAIISKIESSSTFIEWRVSGMIANEHIIDILLKNDFYKIEAEFIQKYYWQAFVQTDRVSSDEMSLFSDVMLAMKEILARSEGRDVRHSFEQFSEARSAMLSDKASKWVSSNLGSMHTTSSSRDGDSSLTSDELIFIDPDGISNFGHYLAYNQRLMRAAEDLSLNIHFFLNSNVDTAFLPVEMKYSAIFDAHSWDLAKREVRSDTAHQFEVALRSGLKERLAGRPACRICLYMYCGSIEHAFIVSSVLADFPNVRAVIHLFWLFDAYKTEGYLEGWAPFLREQANNSALKLTVATRELQALIREGTGTFVSEAPHPSTTFDDEFAASVKLGDRVEKDSWTILFPGGMRTEKGFETSLDAAVQLTALNTERFRCVMAARSNSNTPPNFVSAVEKLRASSIVFENNELKPDDFLKFLSRGDIFVIPYKASAFANRPSGMLIDAIVLGRPVVVIEGTWLADLVKRFGWGMVVEDSATAVADAVVEITTNYTDYVLSIENSRAAFLAKNSWYGLIESLGGPLTASEFSSEGNGLILECAREAHIAVDETEVVAHMLSGRHGRKHIMLDVGAHFGTSASFFDALGWSVHCFEPDPSNCAKLLKRFDGRTNVIIDTRAVSDRPATGVSFFKSNESTGISGLHAFRDTHREDGKVDVTTVTEIVAEKGLDHIDFLKIDVEGFDFNVLKGVPWNQIQPDMIECEFEDFKTVPLGHTYKEVAQYLVDQGYAVYLSEWHPIVRYGIRHDWRRVVPFPGEALPSDAWGNIVAFKQDPGFDAVQAAFGHVIDRKRAKPKTPVPGTLAASAPDVIKAAMKAPVSAAMPVSVKASAKQAGPPAKSASAVEQPRVSTPARSSSMPQFAMSSLYSRFAHWAVARNPIVYRSGQFAMWCLRTARRQKLAVGLFLVALVVLIAAAVMVGSPSLRIFFGLVTLALLGVTTLVAVLGFVGHLLKKAEENARAGETARQRSMRMLDQRLRDAQQATAASAGALKALTADIAARSVDTDGQKSRLAALDASAKANDQAGEAMQAALSRLETKVDREVEGIKAATIEVVRGELAEGLRGTAEETLGTLRGEFAQRLENTKAETAAKLRAELAPRMDEVGKTIAEVRQFGDIQQFKVRVDKTFNDMQTIKRTSSLMNVANFQYFKRSLTSEEIDIMIAEWAKPLGIEVKRNRLAYIAHRAASLEMQMRGRLATSVETIVLRCLVCLAVKRDDISILEIGTLFGVGAAAAYEAAANDFDNVHLTVIDPLDGYYGTENRDVLSGARINERTLRQNWRTAQIPDDSITIIKRLSETPEAIEAAKAREYDILIIDGDHSRAGVKQDFENYIDMVRPGGFVLFDDYDVEEWPDIKSYVDEEVKDLHFLQRTGSGFRTAVFQVRKRRARASA